MEYTDNIDTPLWNVFLNDIFDGDQELIRYMQKAVGYSMTGSTTGTVYVFLLWQWRQTVRVRSWRFINAILGDYANIQPETIMVKNNQGANSDIARLKGARFIITVEPE